MLSKTLAEKAAWEYAKGNGIDLVIMNPGFVIGPLLQPTLNLSVELIQNLISGTLQQLSFLSVEADSMESGDPGLVPANLLN